MRPLNWSDWDTPAIWLPGGQIDSLGRLADVIGATTAAMAGSAIISLDVYQPEMVSGLYAQLEATAPGRLVAGLGKARRAPGRCGR